MRNCLVCTKKNLWQNTVWVDWETGARWMKCRNCGHEQVEEPPQGLRIPPKILYLDIETALMRVSLYDLYSDYNTRISKDMIDRHRFVINWAATWVKPGEYTAGKILSGVVTPSEAKRQDDRRILRDLYGLMDAADYWCGHNLKSFDTKILKWRFLFHGWGYPVESRQVDTLTMARRTKPESRGLEYISEQLGGRSKMGLSQTEWRTICDKGDEKLLRKADKYCRGDVREGVTVLRHFTQAEEQSGKVVFR